MTAQILGRRRLAALRDLGEQTMGLGVSDACARAAQTLANHPYDIPFALLYLLMRLPRPLLLPATQVSGRVCRKPRSK